MKDLLKYIDKVHISLQTFIHGMDLKEDRPEHRLELYNIFSLIHLNTLRFE